MRIKPVIKKYHKRIFIINLVDHLVCSSIKLFIVY